ncbi:MAG: hypothetical protein KJS97_00035 [Alphaproteobacteria bacterium]|nr:hypothetical protein [Alphaproteobacteria bacterium]
MLLLAAEGRETHKMMLDLYQQTKNMLVSYSPKKLGFFRRRAWAGPDAPRASGLRRMRRVASSRIPDRRSRAPDRSPNEDDHEAGT